MDGPEQSAAEPGPRRTAPTAEAILAATEQLLGEHRFSELAVEDIVNRAGVSRASFYGHFPSRGAVLAACLRRVVDQITRAVDPFLSAGTAGDPAPVLRASLRRWVGVAAEHGPLLRTVSEEWPHDPELRELWFAVMDGFADGTAGVIRRARAADPAAGQVDPDALATVLMWGCERVLHLALAGGAPGLDGPEAIVEPLTQMLLGGAFGRGLT